ncbi:MAG: HTH domain-containing protein, partial [Rikenellaceae bacterium]|nr:HTH domain-containing protein [Rikenellaceae bacterium]
MDQPKIERVLRLMKMMTANNNYTIDEMAERLGTSYRSIYRYIETFRNAGFVVQRKAGGV